MDSHLDPRGTLRRDSRALGRVQGRLECIDAAAGDTTVRERTREHTREHSPAHAWELINKIRTAMFITRDGESLDSRPLQAYPDEEAGRVCFMTDSEGLLAQLQADDRVLLSFADPSGNDYVCLTGQASVSNDRARIKELWTVWAEAFWDGPEDPGIRVITVTPEQARYWDAPNAAVATLAMLKGVVTGKQPDLGTSGKASL
jgi:general stress protein 26